MTEPQREAIGVIRPGDTLLLSTEQMLTNQQAATIQAAVEAEIPGIHVVVVGGLKATVMRDDE